MRRWLPWTAIAAGLLLVAILGRGADDTGTPLDPRSSGPLGARGLVLLLDQFGADVTIGPVPTGDVAVLLADDLGDEQTDDLEDWVRSGGTLIVADPASTFVPAIGRSARGLLTDDTDAEIEPDCPLDALESIDRIDVPNPAGYRLPVGGAVGCFPVDTNFYLVASGLGDGSVIALGGGAPFVNSRITVADNSVLAVALMAPTSGTDVVILEPGAAGGGAKSLTDLLPDRTRTVFWQLAIAFVLLVLWRSRRLGRPIEERQPVDLPGSELVLATGGLMQAARRREEAGAMLRANLARELGSRFGVAPEQRDRLRALLVERGADPIVVEQALGDTPAADDPDLIDIGRAVDALRREATNV